MWYYPRMKRTYELMGIVKSDFPVDDKKKLEELVGKLAKGATIQDISVIGKKSLAYPIKKQKEGIYFVATLAANQLKASDLTTEAKLGSDVIRCMLITKEG